GVAGSSGGAPGTGGGGAGRRGPPPSGPGGGGRPGGLPREGKRTVDGVGEAVELRGRGLFWAQWSDHYTARTVDQLADDWQASVVRAALGVENGGYLNSQAANEAKVVAVVDRAIERGVYVIIDWHDHNALDHQAAAVDFFTRMATK